MCLTSIGTISRITGEKVPKNNILKNNDQLFQNSIEEEAKLKTEKKSMKNKYSVTVQEEGSSEISKYNIKVDESKECGKMKFSPRFFFISVLIFALLTGIGAFLIFNLFLNEFKSTDSKILVMQYISVVLVSLFPSILAVFFAGKIAKTFAKLELFKGFINSTVFSNGTSESETSEKEDSQLIKKFCETLVDL